MSGNNGYNFENGLWHCTNCSCPNLEETSITSLVRVYEPELSYHMNVRCVKCKTTFTIMLFEREYLQLMDYDKPIG